MSGGGCGDRAMCQVISLLMSRYIPSTGAETKTRTRATRAHVNILLVRVILQDIVTWAVKGQGGVYSKGSCRSLGRNRNRKGVIEILVSKTKDQRLFHRYRYCLPIFDWFNLCIPKRMIDNMNTRDDVDRKVKSDDGPDYYR